MGAERKARLDIEMFSGLKQQQPSSTYKVETNRSVHTTRWEVICMEGGKCDNKELLPLADATSGSRETAQGWRENGTAHPIPLRVGKDTEGVPRSWDGILGELGSGPGSSVTLCFDDCLTHRICIPGA